MLHLILQKKEDNNGTTIQPYDVVLEGGGGGVNNMIPSYPHADLHTSIKQGSADQLSFNNTLYELRLKGPELAQI